VSLRHTQDHCPFLLLQMNRFAALDTRFLLALSAGEPDAEATIDYLARTGFFPIITESVFEQLGHLARSPGNPAHESAKHACKWLATWNILDPPNRHIEIGISEINAAKILGQELIPGCTENEAKMLIEASCQNCELFITFSEPLLRAEVVPLNLALLEMELNKVTVTIASPVIIARRLEIMNREAKAAFRPE
jgi:hypothetical protein